MRGGDRSSTFSRIPFWGRSPHARGRPHCCHFHILAFGSIPACAGETSPQPRSGRFGWVDPRMRGGDASSSKVTAAGEGRSPHARGRQWSSGARRSWNGSIPACAGETCMVFGMAYWSGVDPRMRGGDPGRRTWNCRSKGRSPHARGRHVPEHAGGRRQGSIPACAGETFE